MKRNLSVNWVYVMNFLIPFSDYGMSCEHSANDLRLIKHSILDFDFIYCHDIPDINRNS